MPISRATARSDSPAAPSVASWRRAISVISLVSSARTRSRALRLAFTPVGYQSTACKQEQRSRNRPLHGMETRVSARRPGTELLGVAYCPDVLDPVAHDVEREHRHGDAVLLSHQAGLAV